MSLCEGEDRVELEADNAGWVLWVSHLLLSTSLPSGQIMRKHLSGSTKGGRRA